MKFKEWFDKEVVSEIRFSLEPLVKRKKALAFLVLLVVVALFLGRYNKALVFIPLLTVIASLSMIYNIFFRLTLGFELILLATVLCSVAYGPVVGAVVGMVSLFCAEFISTKLTYNTFVGIIAIAIIGVISSFHLVENITTWGIAMVVLYDIIIVPGYIITGSSPVSSFIYLVTHIPFNIWIFYYVAPKVFELML